MILLNNDDTDGFPIPIMHLCTNERLGKVMTKKEIHEFGIKIVLDYYLSMLEGRVISINNNLSNHYPHIVTENSIAGLLYIWIKTSIRPELPELNFALEYNEIMEICMNEKAIPVFGGVYLSCVCPDDKGIPYCGEGYFAEFTLFKRIDLIKNSN